MKYFLFFIVWYEVFEDSRAVVAVAGDLRRAGLGLHRGEEEGGLGAVLLQRREVQLEEAAGGEARVPTVCPVPGPTVSAWLTSL